MSPQELRELRDKVNERQNRDRAKRIVTMKPEQEAEWRAHTNFGNMMRRNAARDRVFNAYGGYVCACCGEDERAFLTLDHVENNGSEHKREFNLTTGEMMHRWIIKNGFPEGFQVLCMNCNWGKRNNDGICPHQCKVQRPERKLVGPSGPKRSAPVVLNG